MLSHQFRLHLTQKVETTTKIQHVVDCCKTMFLQFQYNSYNYLSLGLQCKCLVCLIWSLYFCEFLAKSKINAQTRWKAKGSP